MLVYLLSSRDSSNFIQNMGLAARGLAEQCRPPLFIHSAVSTPVSQWDFTTDFMRPVEPR